MNGRLGSIDGALWSTHVWYYGKADMGSGSKKIPGAFKVRVNGRK